MVIPEDLNPGVQSSEAGGHLRPKDHGYIMTSVEEFLTDVIQEKDVTRKHDREHEDAGSVHLGDDRRAKKHTYPRVDHCAEVMCPSVSSLSTYTRHDWNQGFYLCNPGHHAL